MQLNFIKLNQKDNLIGEFLLIGEIQMIYIQMDHLEQNNIVLLNQKRKLLYVLHPSPPHPLPDLVS